MGLFWFVTALQFAYVPVAQMRWDVGRASLLAMGFAGISMTLWLSYKKRLQYQHYVMLAPIAYMAVRGCVGGIWGYTDLLVAETLGVMALAVWASMVESKWIYRALAVASILQIIITVCHLVPWQTGYEQSYTYGTMRHHIRFATLMFAGMLSAVWMVQHEKSLNFKLLAWVILPSTIAAIVVAGSHTILALAAAGLCVIAVLKYGRNALYVFAVLAAMAICFEGPKQFTADDGRKSMWKTAIRESTESVPAFLIGHGIGAWELQAGAIGQKNVGHPHSSILSMVYEQGFIGFVLWAVIVIAALLLCAGEPVLMLLFGLVTASTFTNSLFYYYDIELIWALLLGAAYRRAK